MFIGSAHFQVLTAVIDTQVDWFAKTTSNSVVLLVNHIAVADVRRIALDADSDSDDWYR